MDCNKCMDYMSPALDGALTEDEMLAFQAHLDQCQTCADEYAFYQSIQGQLMAAGEDEVPIPEGFHETLMEKIHSVDEMDQSTVDATTSGTVKFKVARRYYNVAAVFVMVVVLALFGINNMDWFRGSSDLAVTESANEMTGSSEEATSADTEMITESAMVEEVSEEAGSALDRSLMAVSEYSEDSALDEQAAVAVTFEESMDSGTVTEEETVMTAVYEEDARLSRESSGDTKSTKSLQMNASEFSGSEYESHPLADSPILWFVIIGGFVGVIAVSVVWIVKKS